MCETRQKAIDENSKGCKRNLTKRIAKIAKLRNLLLRSAMVCGIGITAFFYVGKTRISTTDQDDYFISVIQRVDCKTLADFTQSMNGMTRREWEELFGEVLGGDNQTNRSRKDCGNRGNSAAHVPQRLSQREAEMVLKGIKRHIKGQIGPNPWWLRVQMMIEGGKDPDAENLTRYLDEVMRALEHAAECSNNQ